MVNYETNQPTNHPSNYLLSFNPSRDNALDKVLLADKEEDQTGERDHEGGAHEQVILGT